MSGTPAGWGEFLLRGRYIDLRKLKLHLENTFGKNNYRLSTQRDFYIINTPQDLTPEQKQELEKKTSLKFAPANKRRGPTVPKGPPKPQNPSPPISNSGSTDKNVATKSNAKAKWSLAKLGIRALHNFGRKQIAGNSTASTVKPESSEAPNVQS
ncbi:hypothetical protein BKA65DRAFT_41462 [Rhexocercosporidium sp. MPI-PUGE-AT-0058]|nr:hypothetical protein BKA65DRAFT_41462 [Rhexocercosporidium sp. MPI-PUGE-AT-0058]